MNYKELYDIVNEKKELNDRHIDAANQLYFQTFKVYSRTKILLAMFSILFSCFTFKSLLSIPSMVYVSLLSMVSILMVFIPSIQYVSLLYTVFLVDLQIRNHL